MRFCPGPGRSTAAASSARVEPGGGAAPGAWSEIAVRTGIRQRVPALRAEFLARDPFCHFEERILCSRLVEQHLGVPQIGSIEALGEPAIDFGEHRARLVAEALFCKQPREASGRA
jgi:hypothetical protein